MILIWLIVYYTPPDNELEILTQKPFLHRKTELCGIIIVISKPVLLVFGTRTSCPKTGPTADSVPPEAAGLRCCFLVTKLKRGDEAKINSSAS